MPAAGGGASGRQRLMGTERQPGRMESVPGTDGRTAATDCTLRSDKMASVRYVYLTTVNKVEGPRGGRGVRG